MSTSLSQLDRAGRKGGVRLAELGDGIKGGEIAPLTPTTESLGRTTIVVIERQALIRDCLTRCLRSVAGHHVIAVSTVDDWLELCRDTRASLVVLCRAGKSQDDKLRGEICRLSQTEHATPTVVLSDAEEVDRIVDALDKGARGYIPTNLSLDVAIEAMRLVKAGGTFVPASCLSAVRSRGDRLASQRSDASIFTPRQAAVLDALRRGKANKVIAYELNMRESTVKVHVRNIMKKLNARNRTEVAFIANELATAGNV